LQVLAGLNPCFPSVSKTCDNSNPEYRLNGYKSNPKHLFSFTGLEVQSDPCDGRAVGQPRQALHERQQIHQRCHRRRRHSLCSLVSTAKEYLIDYEATVVLPMEPVPFNLMNLISNVSFCVAMLVSLEALPV